jgi:hypothetical protein
MILRLPLLLAAATGVLPAGEIRLRLIAESGLPLAGARATVVYTTPEHGAEQVRAGPADPAGLFVAHGTAIGRVLVRAEAPGFYPVQLELPPADEPRELRLALRDVRRPVALHVRRLRVEWDAMEPPPPPGTVEVQTYELDLELGEPLPPRGRGRRGDVRVRVEREFLGWKFSPAVMAELRAPQAGVALGEADARFLHGRWRARFELAVPEPGGGWSEVSGDYLPSCALAMPHAAPEQGYTPAWTWSCRTGERCGEDLRQPARGYFLRVRPVRDGSGAVIAWHHAKFSSGVQLDARGDLGLTVHFNPAAGDRNLEFDPGRNLAAPGVPDDTTRQP